MVAEGGQARKKKREKETTPWEWATNRTSSSSSSSRNALKEVRVLLWSLCIEVTQLKAAEQLLKRGSSVGAQTRRSCVITVSGCANCRRRNCATMRCQSVECKPNPERMATMQWKIKEWSNRLRSLSRIHNPHFACKQLRKREAAKQRESWKLMHSNYFLESAQWRQKYSSYCLQMQMSCREGPPGGFESSEQWNTSKGTRFRS